MIVISNNVFIPDNEVEITAVRSQGAGGQNVNKVASAAHLRFPIASSSLPELIKSRLFAMKHHYLTQSGEIVIKGQRFRTQERNRADVVERLRELIHRAMVPPKKRKKTKIPAAVNERRLENKARNSRTKQLRSKVVDY